MVLVSVRFDPILVENGMSVTYSSQRFRSDDKTCRCLDFSGGNLN